MRLLSLLLLTIFFYQCESTKTLENPIEVALHSDNLSIERVMNNPDQYEIQIVLSEIIRTSDSISFLDHEFRLNNNHYFYPASTVKFPIALLALEKSNIIPEITSDKVYVFEDDSIKHTIRDDIEKIFAVSDNDAYNRLYEFLGRDFINTRLQSKKIGPVRIAHRLSVPNSTLATTKSISYWDNDSIVYIQDSMVNDPIEPLDLDHIKKGIGYYKDSILIKEPMDFSEKNYLPIRTLHNLMKRTIFPEAFPDQQIFYINSDDRRFLLHAMKALPRESGYDPATYYDGYVKFFMYGDTKDRIPSNIEIYNKVGYAYGYLTDCAYIIDTETKTEFILTATIHVNKNGIFNDDNYEYDSIGIPFLSQLGKEIYNHLNTKK